MKLNKLIASAVIGLGFLGATSAWAGNKLVNVQGKLTDSAGTPLTGSKTVTFRLYNNIGDTTPVWTESQTITLSAGLFNASLGSVTSLDSLSFNRSYYLGIQVAGDANELSPRQALGASAFALGSQGDFNVKGNLTSSGTVTAAGAITSAVSITAPAAILGTAASVNLTVTHSTMTNLTVGHVSGPFTNWQKYTPTVNGCSGLTSNFMWRRVGDTLEIWGQAFCGATSATTAWFTLPSGIAIDYSKVGGAPTWPNTSVVGQLRIAYATGTHATYNEGDLVLFADGTDTGKVFCTNLTDTAKWTKPNINGLVGPSDIFTVRAEMPIAGWSF